MSLRSSAVSFLQGFARGICNKKKGAPKKLKQISNRSQVGLYHGKDIRFGNTISFSHKKNRRTWKPNVHKKSLWSETLERWIRFHITTHALRCVDKAGGIDRYLLHTRDEVINSKEGMRAKQEIMHVMNTTPKAKRKGILAERPTDGTQAAALAGELSVEQSTNEDISIGIEQADKLAGDRAVTDPQ